MNPVDENRDGLAVIIIKDKLYCAVCGLSLEDIKDDEQLKTLHKEFHR